MDRSKRPFSSSKTQTKGKLQQDKDEEFPNKKPIKDNIIENDSDLKSHDPGK